MPIDYRRNGRVIELGTVRIDVESRVLQRNGQRVRLQEQPFKVLEMLLARPGALITREQLREALWPGTVQVDFTHGLNNAISRLREALGDDRAAPRFIETVPRRGYRFIHPLPGTRNEQIAAPKADVVEQKPRSRIAVLPFVDMSAGEDVEHIGHGLVEGLVERLASASDIDVVARTSAYEFNGDRDSPAAVAAALDVQYYVDGSILFDRGGMRLTVRLIDVHSGHETWSRRFGQPDRNVREASAKIARAIVETLGLRLGDETNTSPVHPDALRMYRIAKAHLRGFAQPADHDLAVSLLQQAIELDASFAPAYAALASHYVKVAMVSLTDAEFGERFAARAVELDSSSSDAWHQLANYTLLRARRSGDYATYLKGQEQMQRSIALDPGNSPPYEDYGRALLWTEPDLAMRMLERAVALELLCTSPNHMILMLHGSRGDLGAARELWQQHRFREPDDVVITMALGTLETYFGDFTRAVPLLESVQPMVKGAARIQLWSIYLSMGDHDAAVRCLDFGQSQFEAALSEAARRAMKDDHEGAYRALEAIRGQVQPPKLLDAPTAKFAMLAGHFERALEILSNRWPDLATGIEPISARNLLPALDLATARARTGTNDTTLCDRVAAYLSGPDALRFPMFAVQRARLHGLQGDVDAACDALDCAYDAGLRTLWALDLRPQSDLYIDPLIADPALDRLRDTARFQQWVERTTAANERQREQLAAAS